MSQVPNHIAIIMDGNGRWAKQQGKPRTYGHYIGTENVRNIAIKANQMGVKVLTLYAFSTENWKRPQEEVQYLMSLPAIFIERFLGELMENHIKIDTIGNLDQLPTSTRDVLIKAKNKTQNNTAMTLVFAVNYGGRWDIVQAVNQILTENPTVKSICEEDISKHISTSSYPEVDFLIRTSLDYRLSNFLLWQLSYAEFYFTDIHWPDFTAEEFEKAVTSFTKRNRRFGGLV